MVVSKAGLLAIYATGMFSLVDTFWIKFLNQSSFHIYNNLNFLLLRNMMLISSDLCSSVFWKKKTWDPTSLDFS